MHSPIRRRLTILAFLAAFPGAALAHDDCFVPMADWQPRAAVADLARDKGWTVRRIKIDDGCYEIDGTDDKGQRFEATIHPSTLEVIRIETEGHGKDRGHKGSD